MHNDIIGGNREQHVLKNQKNHPTQPVSLPVIEKTFLGLDRVLFIISCSSFVLCNRIGLPIGTIHGIVTNKQQADVRTHRLISLCLQRCLLVENFVVLLRAPIRVRLVILDRRSPLIFAPTIFGLGHNPPRSFGLLLGKGFETPTFFAVTSTCVTVFARGLAYVFAGHSTVANLSALNLVVREAARSPVRDEFPRNVDWVSEHLPMAAYRTFVPALKSLPTRTLAATIHLLPIGWV
jgi:hypothetical protein